MQREKEKVAAKMREKQAAGMFGFSRQFVLVFIASSIRANFPFFEII